eukprot:13530-Heterococcus_DN1.PRE.8
MYRSINVVEAVRNPLYHKVGAAQVHSNAHHVRSTVAEHCVARVTWLHCAVLAMSLVITPTATDKLSTSKCTTLVSFKGHAVSLQLQQWCKVPFTHISDAALNLQVVESYTSVRHCALLDTACTSCVNGAATLLMRNACSRSYDSNPHKSCVSVADMCSSSALRSYAADVYLPIDASADTAACFQYTSAIFVVDALLQLQLVRVDMPYCTKQASHSLTQPVLSRAILHCIVDTTEDTYARHVDGTLEQYSGQLGVLTPIQLLLKLAMIPDSDVLHDAPRLLMIGHNCTRRSSPSEPSSQVNRVTQQRARYRVGCEGMWYCA